MDCSHISKVLEWGFDENHDFRAKSWGCVLCDIVTEKPFQHEDVDIDHVDCDDDCFGCKIKTLELSTGDAGRPISKSKWEGRLDFYKKAREQGIQPAGTQRHQVEAAYKASENLGSAYDAGTMSVKAEKITKNVAKVMKETGAA